ncbi:MAG: choline/carnitine O-acyltransferase [Hyphomicrobiaceae bacterium]
MESSTAETSVRGQTRTFARQHELPRIPVPKLSDTASRFLQWCQPLLTEDEYSQTRDSLEQFVRPGGPGEALHNDLLRYNSEPGVHSWLDDFWSQRYLGRRDPIAINANFFFLFPNTGLDQIARATNLIAGAVHYKHQLDNETLPVATMRGKPLCMEETKYLFSATRIPAHGRDEVRKPYSKSEPGRSAAKHILVFNKGHMFTLEVFGDDGAPYTPSGISEGLRAIQAASPTHAEAGKSVGHLTTMARTTWADHRQGLMANPKNSELINRIETALFVVALEDLNPKEDLQACDNLLHGNSANRYFDKAVTFIVFANGRAGINIEHCGLDSTTVLDFVDSLHSANTATHAENAGAVPQGIPPVDQVAFDLTAQQQAIIHKAGGDFAIRAQNAASATFCFNDFGTRKIKTLNVSPDAFFQLAMQLAHKRTKGMIGATYESIATRQYDHGRTEAMRVVTPEIIIFVDTMLDAAKDNQSRIAALRAAAAAHVNRSKQCQAGDAPEQHLWELLMIHGRRGSGLEIAPDVQPTPPPTSRGLFGWFKRKGKAEDQVVSQAPFPLYDSPGWIKMRDDFLSTSSAPSVNSVYFGFSSTAPQCIGVGYVLRPDTLNAYLCTPADQSDQRDAFADNLRAALRELADLLANDQDKT